MKAFDIVKPDVCLLPALKEKIDNLTKPKGSLGRLEELAIRVGLVQQTLSPKLQCPQNIIFAADHGIAAEGVSLSPKAITWQQVCNFVKGGAGINFLCRQHNFKLKIVDAGVDYDFSHLPGVIDMKVRRGSRNFLYEAAMTDNEFYLCIERGATIVSQCHKEGANVLSFGEMGIGNTSPSSVWMSLFTGMPLQKCIGAGSGLNACGMQHKHDVLSRAIDNYRGNGTPLDIIRYFGGLEMVMAVGAMLQAAQLKILILVDGFIMSNCVLAASKLYPEVLDYAIFTHCSDEAGHRLLLDYLHVSPLLDLGLRLGEGTGAVCAFPLIDSAVRMINEMDSFSHAGVEKYF